MSPVSSQVTRAVWGAWLGFHPVEVFRGITYRLVGSSTYILPRGPAWQATPLLGLEAVCT